MRLFVLLPLLLALVLAALPAPADTSAQGLFATHCQACHGPEGKGDGPAGGALNPKPADLTRRPYKNGCCPTAIYNTLSKGVAGTAMPSFASTLDDASRQELAQYVRGLQTAGCEGGGCGKGKGAGCGQGGGHQHRGGKGCCRS